MPKRLKKLSEEVMHENPWWKYKRDRYVLPTGLEGEYYYAETPGIAMIIPVLENGTIALTLQYRYLADKQSIEFPAGGIKHYEPQEAARRELEEETGYIADELIKLAVVEPANGFVKDTMHIFLARVSTANTQRLDDTEEIDILYRKPEEIDRMIIQGDIWCGETVAAWFFARHHLFQD